jgi:hypothetical protein
MASVESWRLQKPVSCLPAELGQTAPWPQPGSAILSAPTRHLLATGRDLPRRSRLKARHDRIHHSKKTERHSALAVWVRRERWIILNLKMDHIRRIAASELPNAGGALIGLLYAMSGLPTSTWSECGLRPQNVNSEAPGDEA